MSTPTTPNPSVQSQETSTTSGGTTPTATGGPLLFDISYSGKAMTATFIFLTLFTMILASGTGYLSWQKSADGNFLTSVPHSVIWGVSLGIQLLCWVYYGGIYFYRTLTIRYQLTDHYLRYMRGLLQRETDTLEVLGIDDVKMVQTLWDRVVNGGVGTIIVYSQIDKSHPELKMSGIDNPHRILELIDDARRRRRGMRGIMLGAG